MPGTCSEDAQRQLDILDIQAIRIFKACKKIEEISFLKLWRPFSFFIYRFLSSTSRHFENSSRIIQASMQIQAV